MATTLYNSSINVANKYSTGSSDYYSNAYTFRLEVIENSYSVNTNKSNVTINAYAYGRYGYWYTISTTQTINLYTSKTGSTSVVATQTNNNLSHKSETLFATYTGDLEHNDDGSLYIEVSSVFTYGGTSQYMPKNNTIYTGGLYCTTIPRASSIGDVSGNIGATVTIPIDRKSNDFTTTLTYSFGSLNGTIVSKTSSVTPTWTIPTSFYAQIPNTKYGTGTITCKTYNGNTQVGSSVTKTLTANAVEANVNPTVTISNVVETDTKLINKLGSGGAYIRGYSKPKVTFSASARSSASLSTLNVNGVSVPTNTTQHTINNITTDAISITATDSRGYSKATSQTLTPFNNYSPPIATFTTLKRNTPTNGQIDVAYSGTWYNANFNASNGTIANTLNASLQYKESGTSTWINYGNLTPTISSNNFSQTITIGDNGTIGGLFDYTKAWDIKLTLKDYLCDGNTGYDAIVITGNITKGKPTFWWDDDLHVEGDLYVKGNNFSNILNMLHPVGEIYLTTSSPSVFNPNTAFGGTWSQLTGNQYLRIMSSNMAQTGGSNTITVDNLPSHSHTMSHTHSFYADFFIRHGYTDGTETVAAGTNTTISSSAYSAQWAYGYNVASHPHHPDGVIINGTTGASSASSTGSTGSGTAFYPSYYGVYAWRRTA